MSRPNLFSLITWLPLFLYSGLSFAVEPHPGENKEYTIKSDALERTYSVYQSTKRSLKAQTLIIVLHGGLGNAQHMQDIAAMNTVADTNGLLVAYADGTSNRPNTRPNSRVWNAGSCCTNRQVNDVRFISDMIQHIRDNYRVHAENVFISGFSNGAMMALRYACESPQSIRGAISVAGTLAIDGCVEGAIVPILFIHGDADENVPFLGGDGDSSIAGGHRSVPDAIKILSEGRACRRPSVVPTNGFSFWHYDCFLGEPIELFLLKGVGHVWPGGDSAKNDPELEHGFSASERAWHFVERFSL